MSGIAGIMNYSRATPAHNTLQRMTDAMLHRGPNDSGIWTDAGIGLGHRGMAEGGASNSTEPISNEDDTLQMVCNGVIYNDKQLRSDLINRGHRFKTNTDIEVIVHLYEEYGEGCVTKLRGMFSFVIWDRKKEQLFGARDHFGVKPFYYMDTPDQFVFCSEIKGLLQADTIKRDVDRQALYHFMTFQYVPEPATIFQGIRKLPPAHFFTMTTSRKLKVSRYWDPMFEPEATPLEQQVEQLRERLKESVRLHMKTDAAQGCFLSSGIDSTAIAAQMSEIAPLKTFSVGFEGPRNETEIAAQTAAAIGAEHYAEVITEHDFFKDLKKAVWHLDEPIADPSAIALYHLAALAKKHVTTALSGEGADELFGGYLIYREPSALKPFDYLPGPFKSILHSLASFLPEGLSGRNYILRGTTPLEKRFLGNAKIFSEDMKQDVLNHAVMSENNTASYELAETFYKKTKHLDPVSRMQYIDLNLWLPGDILMKADKMSMAHSLQVRVPFLDTELFELARKIPAQFRIAEGTTKYVFRQAMEGIVPDFILHRPKLGFPVPIRDWLKTKRGEMIREEIMTSGIDHLFDLEEVDLLYKHHRAGRGDHSRKLWLIYIFGLWYSTYMLEELGEIRVRA